MKQVAQKGTERFVGASRVLPVGQARLSERVSYFSGPRPNWRTALPTFETVRYPSLSIVSF